MQAIRQSHAISRKLIEEAVVLQCYVALGSNFFAKQNLSLARYYLSGLLDDVRWSEPYRNPDFTATIDRPKPDYVNQCGHLSLPVVQPMTFGRLAKLTKSIETTVKQAAFANLNNSANHRQVAIDIDILLVALCPKQTPHIASSSGSGSNSGILNFIAIAERLPFKHHERVGLSQLMHTAPSK